MLLLNFAPSKNNHEQNIQIYRPSRRYILPYSIFQHAIYKAFKS